MSDSEAELAAVADLVESGLVKLVHLLGTRAAVGAVRDVIERGLVEAYRRGDPDTQPTPLRSPRAVVEAPRLFERKTTPSTPAAKRPRRK